MVHPACIFPIAFGFVLASKHHYFQDERACLSALSFLNERQTLILKNSIHTYTYTYFVSIPSAESLPDHCISRYQGDFENLYININGTEDNYLR